MTRDGLLRYLDALGPDFRALYGAADALEKAESHDTLSEAYQLAAAVEALFWARAEAWLAARGEDGPGG